MKTKGASLNCYMFDVYVDVFTYVPIDIMPSILMQGPEKVSHIINVVEELNVILKERMLQLQTKYKQQDGLTISVVDSHDMFHYAYSQFDTDTKGLGYSLDLETCKLREGCSMDGANEKAFWDIHHPSTTFHRHMATYLKNETG